MNNNNFYISLLFLGSLAFTSCIQNTAETSIESNSVQEVPKMKMTTDIPDGISTPNTLETKTLGQLEFFDGVPNPQTEQEVYDYIDLHNAVDAYVKGIHIASMEAMKQGLLSLGPANTTAFLFEELMDS